MVKTTGFWVCNQKPWSPLCSPRSLFPLGQQQQPQKPSHPFLSHSSNGSLRKSFQDEVDHDVRARCLVWSKDFRGAMMCSSWVGSGHWIPGGGGPKKWRIWRWRRLVFFLRWVFAIMFPHLHHRTPVPFTIVTSPTINQRLGGRPCIAGMQIGNECHHQDARPREGGWKKWSPPCYAKSMQHNCWNRTHSQWNNNQNPSKHSSQIFSDTCGPPGLLVLIFVGLPDLFIVSWFCFWSCMFFVGGQEGFTLSCVKCYICFAKNQGTMVRSQIS